MIYDHFTENGSGQKLLNTALFPNPSAVLATQLTSNDVYFNGANANAGNGGARVPLYAPFSWSQGSSYAHLAESYNNTPNALMTYSLPNGESIHSPGPVTLGLLKDIGWTLQQASSNYTLTLAKAGTGNGTVSGEGNYTAGAIVTLTATPDANSTFAGWNPSPCAASFTMPANNLTCTATFLSGATNYRPVYRFFNNNAGGHFYTISEAERDTVINNYKWFRYEGVGFYAYPSPTADASPVYRFFNNNAGGHFYTNSEAERDTVINNYKWFRYEGIGFYALP